MKNAELTRKDDLKIEPSEELQAKTLYAMQSAAVKKSGEKRFSLRRSGKKLTACVLLGCMALFLMSMGYRVFDYLAFVPGMGIVTTEQEKVYTLEHVVKGEKYNGSIYYIEAASMVPITEGEYAGMWYVNVMTNEPAGGTFSGEKNEAAPIILTAPDGTECTLEYHTGNGYGASYNGYISSAGSTDYTLRWHDVDYTVTMKALENSVYANYQYPVSNGLTVITFPVADGSDRLIYDVVIDAEDENWRFWAEQSNDISFHLSGITVTDTLGNIYHDEGFQGHVMGIPESEKDVGVNQYLGWKFETYIVLDRRLEAPVASIEIEGLEATIGNMNNLAWYTVTVPEFGKTVTAENMPNGGLFFDTHGVRASFRSISGAFYDWRGGYEIRLEEDEIHADFLPDNAQLIMSLAYIPAEDAENASERMWYYGDSENIAENEEKVQIGYRCLIEGKGDASPNKEPMNLDFGEDVAIRLGNLTLIINSGWRIDFTHPVTESTAE